MEDRLEKILASLKKETPDKQRALTPKELEALRESISKKHDELMETLKNEEKISHEFHRKPF